MLNVYNDTFKVAEVFCCQKNVMLLGAGHFIGEKHKHKAKQSYR